MVSIPLTVKLTLCSTVWPRPPLIAPPATLPPCAPAQLHHHLGPRAGPRPGRPIPPSRMCSVPAGIVTGKHPVCSCKMSDEDDAFPIPVPSGMLPDSLTHAPSLLFVRAGALSTSAFSSCVCLRILAGGPGRGAR